jgi:hypothetical protein
MKKLETVSNIAVLVVAIIVGFVFLRNGNLLPDKTKPRSAADAERQLKGRSVAIADVKTTDTPATLVLAMSTHCYYCGQNTSLYVTLGKIKSSAGFGFVAVAPEPQAEIDEYLQSRHIAPDRVISRSLEAFNVSATPTVLLVNQQGVVQAAWVGVLDSTRQKDVFRKIKEYCPTCEIDSRL